VGPTDVTTNGRLVELLNKDCEPIEAWGIHRSTTISVSGDGPATLTEGIAEGILSSATTRPARSATDVSPTASAKSC
jgi:hypothetical protein